jgi:hypothetical protein
MPKYDLLKKDLRSFENTSNLFNSFKIFSSDGYKDCVKEELEEKLKSTRIQEYSRINDEIKVLSWYEDRKKIDELWNLMHEKFTDSDINNFKLILKQLKLYDGAGYLFEYIGEYGEKIFKKLINGAKNKNEKYKSHPFYKDINNKYMYNNFGKVSINLEEARKIPLSLVVYADNLENWNGRSKGDLKNQRLSSDVVNEYTESIKSGAIFPPVEGANAYLFRSGNVYFGTHNSHRVAAAIKAGKTFIEIKNNIDIFLADEGDYSYNQLS